MTYTEQLKDEHKGIKLMLRIMDRICDRLLTGEQINPEHLEKIVDFLKVFADTCHHAKEEELLFPAMVRAGIPKEGGPIGVMLAEHSQGRAHVKALGEAVADFKAGNSAASKIIVEHARAYIALLSQHIDKEDTILYPMADKYIPKPVQVKLLEEFDTIEKERIGEGRHEEFHKLLKHLKSLYLDQ